MVESGPAHCHSFSLSQPPQIVCFHVISYRTCGDQDSWGPTKSLVGDDGGVKIRTNRQEKKKGVKEREDENTKANVGMNERKNERKGNKKQQKYGDEAGKYE